MNEVQYSSSTDFSAYSLADMVNREFPREELVRVYSLDVEGIVARCPKALEEVMSQRHHEFCKRAPKPSRIGSSPSKISPNPLRNADVQ